MNEEPVSRFWACFFASSIFALIWTIKMQKTKKWVLLAIVTFSLMYAPLIVLVTIMGITEGSAFEDIPYDSSVLVGGLVIVLYLTMPFIGIIIGVYYMFKWTTEYNLKNFGYKSKKEWKQAGSNSQ